MKEGARDLLPVPPANLYKRRKEEGMDGWMDGCKSEGGKGKKKNSDEKCHY